MKSYIVYIIRSGATKEETEGKYIGHTDVELSEEGRKQLENMRSKGIKGIMLVVGTENKRGIKFYEKNGFKRLLTLPDGTVMAKEL